MSDIGIPQPDRDRLVLGSPGLLLGAIAGALLWRRRRVAVLGAGAGFALWLAGWMALRDVT
jgi:Na+/proline symporter